MSVTPNSIVTPQSVQTAFAICTLAKSTYNDSTNAVRLIPAASVPNGALIKRVFAITRATCGATELQLYRSPDAGTTLISCDSQVYPATNVSQTTQRPKIYFGDGNGATSAAQTTPYSDANPLRVEAGEELWCAIGIALAGGMAIVVEYEAY